MGAMNEFLRRLESDAAIAASYVDLDERWNARARLLNGRLAAANLPVRVANLVSVWTVLYEKPSRYNWMFQYYLRAEGLALSVGRHGRLIFSHNYTERDFRAVAERFVAAAEAMQADGWWWTAPAADNKGIRRAILREALAVRFGRRGAAVTGRPEAFVGFVVASCSAAASVDMDVVHRVDELAAQQVPAATCDRAARRGRDPSGSSCTRRAPSARCG
jgi:hypothetical protein